MYLLCKKCERWNRSEDLKVAEKREAFVCPCGFTVESEPVRVAKWASKKAEPTPTLPQPYRKKGFGTQPIS